MNNKIFLTFGEGILKWHDCEIDTIPVPQVAHSPVTSVGQRRDDESASIAEVLVAIRNPGGDHANYDPLLLPVIA